MAALCLLGPMQGAGAAEPAEAQPAAEAERPADTERRIDKERRAESGDSKASSESKPGESSAEAASTSAELGSQKDDRGPIGRGFGERWVAIPTVSSNPKLSTAFGATAMVFFRFDDSVASQVIGGGNYSLSKSWTAYLFTKMYFDHDTQRIMGGIFRGHAANSYDNFMNQAVALESLSNVFATPLIYLHRLGSRTETDWWVGGQFFYLGLDQSGEDAFSSDIIDGLGLSQAKAVSTGPSLLFDSRDNTNSPTSGRRLVVRANAWAQLQPAEQKPFFGSANLQYSQYFPFRYFVLAVNAGAKFTWAAPLIFQSSLSHFRAYTVGEQLGRHMMLGQAEARIPFGKTRFGASAFGGLATLFNNFSDWGDAATYNPMGGAGLRFLLSPKQQSIIRLEYAQGVRGARGIYLAMGQPFN